MFSGCEKSSQTGQQFLTTDQVIIAWAFWKLQRFRKHELYTCFKWLRVCAVLTKDRHDHSMRFCCILTLGRFGRSQWFYKQQLNSSCQLFMCTWLYAGRCPKLMATSEMSTPIPQDLNDEL